MKWINPDYGLDHPKEEQIILGRYRNPGSREVFHLVLRYTVDEGRAYWLNTSTDEDEGEPDAWAVIED